MVFWEYAILTGMKAALLDFRLFLLLCFASALLILFDNFGFLNYPKSTLQTVTVPVQYGLYQTSKNITHQFKFIVLARKAAQENNALKQQLAELLSENSNLRRSLAESEAMVDQQNSLSPKTFNLLPARPIGLGRYLLIDKGADDKVAIKDVVVFKENYIGQIKRISSKTSQVLLSLDPDSTIAVFSQGQEGRAKGILQGQFGSQALMDKILHAEDIKTGDLVYSEGTEGILPRGLVMGKVTQVLERQNEVFKQAVVKPVFEIADLDLIFVIKSL